MKQYNSKKLQLVCGKPLAASAFMKVSFTQYLMQARVHLVPRRNKNPKRERDRQRILKRTTFASTINIGIKQSRPDMFAVFTT
jgi:hypothetical protein